MSRGRPKLIENVEQPKKYTRVFKGEDCDTVWYFDNAVTTQGPIKVDIKWHKTQKQFDQEVKMEKMLKKQKKQQNKFFKLKEEQNDSRSTRSTPRRGRKPRL